MSACRNGKHHERRFVVSPPRSPRSGWDCFSTVHVVSLAESWRSVSLSVCTSPRGHHCRGNNTKGRHIDTEQGGFAFGRGKDLIAIHMVCMGLLVRAKPSATPTHNRCHGVAETLPFFPSEPRRDLME
jgi:hypothetical protein